MEFARQEYWSGLPCPPPGNLPDLGSPALAGGFFTTSTTWEDRWQLQTRSITIGTSLAAQWLLLLLLLLSRFSRVRLSATP